MSTPQSDTRGKVQPGSQNYNNFSRNRPDERRDYSSNNIDRYTVYKERSSYQPNQDQSRNWGGNNNYSQLPSTSQQDSSFTYFRRQPRSNSHNPSLFNRFGDLDLSNDKPYDKKFLTSNNSNQPNVVRFTTTDDSMDELSGLWFLNY